MKYIEKLLIDKNQINLLHDNLLIETIHISNEDLKKLTTRNKDLALKHNISNVSFYLLKNNYSKLSKEEIDKFVNNIKHNPEYIEFYCSNILNKRSPEFEGVILTDSTSATNYALRFFKKRWKEAENLILTDASNSVEYAINIIKKRWRDAEDIISKDSYSSLIYSLEILKERWTDVIDIDPKIGFRAEDNILKETEYAIEYAVDIMKTRWKELEKNILNDIIGLQDADEIFNISQYKEVFKKVIYYIENLMNSKRWKDLEVLLIKNKALRSFRELYAERIIKKSWKAGGIILNHENKAIRNTIKIEDLF